MPTPFNLPEKTVECLRLRAPLEYDADKCEPGEVGLHRLEDLRLGEVKIEPDLEGDPHLNQDGAYFVPAVSLSATCQAYNPLYILLWLPNELRFGTWDCDHGVLIIFDDASWEDILIDPAKYLGAQWNSDFRVGRRFQAWHDYPFIVRTP
jgi:hypothetical protein